MVLEHTELTETLALTNRKDGFWLYDSTRGMNLSMRAKTDTEAFVGALTYYQERLLEVERQYESLQDKVNIFVQRITDEEE